MCNTLLVQILRVKPVAIRISFSPEIRCWASESHCSDRCRRWPWHKVFHRQESPIKHAIVLQLNCVCSNSILFSAFSCLLAKVLKLSLGRGQLYLGGCGFCLSRHQNYFILHITLYYLLYRWLPSLINFWLWDSGICCLDGPLVR